MHPGCANLYPCAAHPPRQAWRSAHHAPGKRILTGRALQVARQRLYGQQQGQCALCHQDVLFTAKSFIRDHITSLAEGGVDTEANTQGLCAQCSDRKTQGEAQRGRARWA